MATYIKYNNLKRIYSANKNMTPAKYENYLKKVSGKGGQEQSVLTVKAG